MSRAESPLAGIAFMLAAVGLWTCHDAASKWLAQSYPVVVVLFWRSVFALLPTLALVRSEGGLQSLPPRLLRLCWLRGLGGAVAYSTYVFALPMMPLANAIAVGLTGPIMIIALSSWLLHERMDPRRWIAVLAGFLAALWIVRPGGGIPPAGGALLLGGTALYAAMMVLTRRLGAHVQSGTLGWHTGLVFALVTGAVVPFFWVLPTPADFAFFLLVGTITGLANYCMIRAFRIAPASTVAPFEYSSIVWATVLGLVVWGDVPSWPTIGGVAVIIAAGTYITLHARAGRSRRT